VVQFGKFDLRKRAHGMPSFAAKLIEDVSRHNTVILILSVCCGVGSVSILVLRDLQSANAEAREMYTRSVHGLKRIAEMQYDAQETRRCTLYALTTTDSNLQVEYADESRDADQGVKNRITEFMRSASTPTEKALVGRLNDEWAAYLAVRDEVVALILEGSTSEAIALDLSKGVPTFERVREDMLEVQRIYDEDASQRQANLTSSSQRSSARLIGIVSFTFLFSSLAVLGIQRSRVLNAIQLTRLQMEFVASMSHELRTPLAVMSSAADNLADGLVKSQDSVNRYGSILRQQSRNMSDLVDRILIFASTEDKHLHQALEPLAVDDLIHSVVRDTNARLSGAAIAIDTQVEPDLPPVLANKVAISQCLYSLIDNAVKYSNQSRRIRIRAYASSALTRSGNELCIGVEDGGIGIDASELPHIFNPFYRSPRVRAAQIHGTGLGLSLAKRIAESMGGRLSVLSALNHGSTFTLHLQFALKEDTPNISEAPAETSHA